MDRLTPAEREAAEALMELRMARPPAIAEETTTTPQRRVAEIRELRRIASHNGTGLREGVAGKRR